MNILEGRAISKRFGGLKAVDNVDIQVEEYQIFGIIGPNGAGKSTFFNVCSGYYPPSEGAVLLCGEDVTRMSPEQIAGKGLARTFQNIKLFNNMSVLENVKIGYHAQIKSRMFDAIFKTSRHRRDERFAEEESLKLLEKIGLLHYKDFRAGNLPYGIQRKLEIARSLAMRPKILLLDEPAAGMNPQETKQLMEFVLQLRQEGLTIVVIEHDMKFVMNLCDTIMVLNCGQKLFQGTPKQVRENAEVAAAYFGSAPQPDIEVSTHA